MCLWAEISIGPLMVNSAVIEKNKIISVKMVFRTGKGGANSDLRLLSRLLFAMEVGALAATTAAAGTATAVDTNNKQQSN